MKILFNLKYHCGFGEHLALVGNKDPLGGWDVDKSVEMKWSEGDMWIGEIILNEMCVCASPAFLATMKFNYKFAQIAPQELSPIGDFFGCLSGQSSPNHSVF